MLWKKVMQGLSAGRVQSVATRLVVERERERRAFVAAGYWDLEGTFDPGSFAARLVALDGSRVAQGSRLRPGRRRCASTPCVSTKKQARGLAAAPRGRRLLRSQRRGEAVHAPAGRAVHDIHAAAGSEPQASLLGPDDDASRAAAVRVGLHHVHAHGLDDAVRVRAHRRPSAGDGALRAEYVPAQPRRYERRVKNAQEAHEAIRPAGDAFRTPQQVAGELSKDELALYELIWMRTVASQMEDARGQTVSIRLGAISKRERGRRVRRVRHRDHVPRLHGRIRGRTRRRRGAEDERANADCRRSKPAIHSTFARSSRRATRPPHRPAITEATLVKALEERGIGRPSTYASILATIVDRGYVFKKGTALVPTFLAFAVVGLLEQHFRQLVDYDFTARLEDDLDRIAAGEEQRVDWLRRFYYGAGDGGDGLHALVTDHLDAIDARAVNSLPIGNDIVLRVGRYGPYLERGDERASVPEDMAPDELTVAKAEELLAKPSGDRVLGTDPATGREIAARDGRYGPYVTEVLPEGATDKPRTASLFKTMSLETDHPRRRAPAALAPAHARGRA